jgi:hypothetical protein
VFKAFQKRRSAGPTTPAFLNKWFTSARESKKVVARTTSAGALE